jgi:hypothetical protein
VRSEKGSSEIGSQKKKEKASCLSHDPAVESRSIRLTRLTGFFKERTDQDGPPAWDRKIIWFKRSNNDDTKRVKNLDRRLLIIVQQLKV